MPNNGWRNRYVVTNSAPWANAVQIHRRIAPGSGRHGTPLQLIWPGCNSISAHRPLKLAMWSWTSPSPSGSASRNCCPTDLPSPDTG